MVNKILILIGLLSLSSCVNTENIDPSQKEALLRKHGYNKCGFSTPLEVIEIDSCEYLFGDWYNATTLTHKGNCKFCKERRSK